MKRDREILFPSQPKALSLCSSVRQLYPLFALHAGDQNIGFQEAGVKTSSADGDVVCPSVSKMHILIVEKLLIVQQFCIRCCRGDADCTTTYELPKQAH